MIVTQNLKIQLSFDEIISLLQKEGTKRKKPNQKLQHEIEKQIEIARELIEPKAIYEIFDSKKLTPRHLFTQSEKTVLAIVTISERLEKLVSQLLKDDKYSKAVILDAIASNAAEELAEKVYQIILKENENLFSRKKYTKRFSPGYCRWELAEGQRMIFDLLPADKIGVKLSASMLMIPRKSVSFAINIGRKIEEGLGEKECNSCEIRDCKYRRY